jgi:branched-chain amino acid transport system ATP-binding protein
MNGENILEVENAAKSFGGLKAVDDVSLSVKRGKIFGLIGPNGSGKSTLFNLVSGTERMDGGRVVFDGKPITGLPSHKILELGLARSFQIPHLFFGMTVLDNTMTAFKGQLGENPITALGRGNWEPQEAEFAAKAKEELALLEIKHLYLKPPTEVSGGQMKLLQFALAFMGNPKMVLLDEPTAGVAPRLAQDIFREIDTHRRERGTTFFIIEHRLEVLFKHVDHVFMMHEGKIIAEGSPGEIVKDKKVIDAYLGG